MTDMIGPVDGLDEDEKQRWAQQLVEQAPVTPSCTNTSASDAATTPPSPSPDRRRC